MKERELTTRQVADRLGVALRTVQNWRNRQVGPKFTRSRKGHISVVRYRLSDIIEFEKAFKITKGVRI